MWLSNIMIIKGAKRMLTYTYKNPKINKTDCTFKQIFRFLSHLPSSSPFHPSSSYLLFSSSSSSLARHTHSPSSRNLRSTGEQINTLPAVCTNFPPPPYFPSLLILLQLPPPPPLTIFSLAVRKSLFFVNKYCFLYDYLRDLINFYK